MTSHKSILKDLGRHGCLNKPQLGSHCFTVYEIKKAALLFERVYVDAWDYISHLSFLDWSYGASWGMNPTDIFGDYVRYQDLPHPSTVFIDPRIANRLSSSLDFGTLGRRAPTNYHETHQRVLVKLFSEGMLKAVPLIEGVEEADNLDSATVWFESPWVH